MRKSNWISRTAGTLGKTYQQSKRPVALALVFIAAIGSILPSSAVQIAALTALCAILVEVLFEIQRYTVEHSRPLSFDNFYDVSLHIEEQIRQRMKRAGKVRIRAIGMSMGHAWPFLSEILRKLLDSNAGAIDVHLAVIDSQWDELVQLNPHWGRTVDGNVARISTFAEANSAQLISSSSSIAISRYAHMPNWHGVLLDDDVLFESTCIWQGDVLAGAENEYEKHVVSDPLGAARIARFTTWFRYNARNLTHRWPAALPAEASPPQT